MKVRYENLSNGYINVKCENGTLNSQYYNSFYNEINKSTDLLTQIMVFTQRIPRAGFFEELYALETTEYKDRFDRHISIIVNKYREAVDNLNNKNTEINARIFINWSNILLRYCLFEEISNYFPNLYSGPYFLEILLIKESNKIETFLSNGQAISVASLLTYAREYISSDVVTAREKIMLLNRIVVYYYRHQKNPRPPL